ncbi:unnamed protein product, partial [Discosporangium mesarthrocarpum]
GEDLPEGGGSGGDMDRELDADLAEEAALADHVLHAFLDGNSDWCLHTLVRVKILGGVTEPSSRPSKFNSGLGRSGELSMAPLDPLASGDQTLAGGGSLGVSPPSPPPPSLLPRQEARSGAGGVLWGSLAFAARAVTGRA